MRDDHGKVSTYTNHWCRCDQCREAWRERCAQNREKRRAKMAADLVQVEHGKVLTYGDYGCRCQPCTDAYSADSKRRRKNPGPIGRPTQPLKHGTAYAYNGRSCRCDDCKGWAREKSAAAKRKKMAKA